jgi:hypothetical protein
MENIKDYIGKLFVNKQLHLKCDCIVGIDITGNCIKYEISGTEVVLIIEKDGKHIPIGLNTPNLQIEILKG